MRFCYKDCTWDTRLKAAVVTLRIDAGTNVDYTGYMVSPGPGLMRLKVARGSQSLGQTIIDVPMPSQ